MGWGDAFARQGAGWEKRQRQRVVIIHKKLAFQALGGSVQGNPVGNPSLWQGRAPSGYTGGSSRNAWQLALSPVDTITFQYAPGGSAGAPPSASQTLESQSNLASLQPFGVVYLANPAPYINRLRQGWSKQAANDWVRATFANIAQQGLAA